MQSNHQGQSVIHTPASGSAAVVEARFRPAAAALRRKFQAHLDLDGAWPRGILPMGEDVDCRAWGPALRYSATREGIEKFHEFAAAHPAEFRLFGSGDFHHLTALWLRALSEPVTLVSFDNHPDWDIRPPRWCCGTWVNRALELPQVRRAIVWGCGNFELNWPGWLFANHRALRTGRLDVRPWAEPLAPPVRRRWLGIHPETWREQFVRFAERLAGESVYVTVDLDCLRPADAATNWESGLFSAPDIAWALRQLRKHAEIVSGDVCGAWSVPRYARWKQKIEAALDHPRQPATDSAEAVRRNTRALRVIWPALTGSDEEDAGADQEHA